MWSEVYLRILRPKRRHRPLLKRLLKVPLNQLQRRQHPQSYHRPYLQQQLDLIRPAAVVTLGRFAAQWLLGTTEGITRLRGRSYPFAHGVLIPTLHPAAALRGGAEPLGQMRSDFVRAKFALAVAGVAL